MTRRWGRVFAVGSPRKPLPWVVTAVAVACGLLIGCRPAGESVSRPKADQPSTSRLSAHSRMRAELLAHEQKSRRADPFFGTAPRDVALETYQRARQLKQPVMALEALMRLVDYELRFGDIEPALEHLAEGEKLLFENFGFIAPEKRNAFLLQYAVAWLRLAENENCVNCIGGEACLFPISQSGIHQEKRGSRKAIEYLNRLLKLDPDHSSARWLLNVAAMTLGEYPEQVPLEHRLPPERLVADSGLQPFPNVAHQHGLDTFGLAGGCACEDFNGDGHLDVIVSDWGPRGQIRYLENDGQGNFVDKTEASNLMGITGGLNLVTADYDNDGDVDFLLLRGAWAAESGQVLNSLIRNEGGGRFLDVTLDCGLGNSRFPTQTAAWGDYDLDGDLDLYIGNEGYDCELFENRGAAGFREVAVAAKVTNFAGYTKAVVWGDVNSDRYPDLFVANYDSPNRLYLNQRDGTFRDVAVEAGLTGPKTSFTSWMWDYNNDGALDIFVSAYPIDIKSYAHDMFSGEVSSQADQLYQGDGQGNFHSVGSLRGLTMQTETMGANYGDLDNDGFLDFYVGTGAPGFEFLVPNLMFRNVNGQRFENITFAGKFGHLQKGHAVAFFDYDEDGDQDVFQVVGGAYPGDGFRNALFENPGNENHWIKIRVVGRVSNRGGIGCRIKCVLDDDGETRTVYRWVNTGGSFGCNPLTQHIGLGKATVIQSLEVFWPQTGQTQTMENVPSDQTLVVEEALPAGS